MSLEKLLQAAARAGGQEVRLIPGRRLVVLTPDGEREAQGAPQTPAAIEALIAPYLDAPQRAGLAAGAVDWTMDVAGLGRVAASVRSHDGALSVRVALTTASRAVAASRTVAASPESPAASPTSTAETRPAVASSVRPAPVEPSPPAPRQVPGEAAAAHGPSPEMMELFRLMAERNASDLHVCVGNPPLLRHDGEIKPVPSRAVLTPADTERLLLPLAPARNREEFARRHDTDFSYEVPGVGRVRCNLFVDRRGMGGVFRIILDKIITAEDMGLPEAILQLCRLPKGLVLVTGPTGSGKSTTLCAMVDYINRTRKDHIITIEDPVEFVHENKLCLVNQREVHTHTESFKDALRAALREDPDIVLVGEMRDLETVAIAIETAETGHLVFGTLHTSSAASTVDRIVGQFPADKQAQVRAMLAGSLKAVISQTLCKKKGGGRVPALEVLICTPSVSNLIREAKIFQIPSVMQTGKKAGMCLLNDSLLDLVQRGLVEAEEAYSRSTERAELLNVFRRNNIDTSWAGGPT